MDLLSSLDSQHLLEIFMWHLLAISTIFNHPHPMAEKEQFLKSATCTLLSAKIYLPSPCLNLLNATFTADV